MKKFAIIGLLSITIFNTYAQISQNNLKAHYKFNNTLWDYSGNDFHGTMLDTLTYTDGVKCQALIIKNNTRNAVQINHTIVDGLNDFTFAFYCKIYGKNNSNNLLSCANSIQPNEFLIGYNTDFYDEFKGWHLRIDNIIYTFQNSSMDDFKWHHVAITRKGSTAQLYIDHKQVGLEIYANPKTLSIDPLGVIIGQDQDCVGGCFDPNQNWNGEIDEFMVYSKALNQSSIDSLDNVTYCKKIENVIVYDTISVTDTLIIDVPFSVDNQDQTSFQKLKVYPNPAKDIINITTNLDYLGQLDYQVKIVNTSGQSIFESELNQYNYKINVTDLGSKGLYFIYIIDGSQNIVDIKKIIIE